MKTVNGMVLTLAASLCTVTASAETIGCPKNTNPAFLSLWGSVTSSAVECLLLEDKELRKLVEKFAAQTVFAWPEFKGAPPGTCFSGSLEGELELAGETFGVTAFAASAQRFFPVPLADDEGSPAIDLTAISDDGSLLVGAAMTAVRMYVDGSTADVLLDDHFLSTEANDDTEDFLIVGSAGDLRLSGRLEGRGTLVPNFDTAWNLQSLTIAFDHISGNVCVGMK